MSYEKRLCILKQIKKGFTADGSPLTGAVYAERMGSELTVTPRIAGLAPVGEGRYALAVRVGEKGYCLELKGNEALRVPDAPSLERGFSALLCFVRGAAEPIAFGACGGAPDDAGLLLALFEGPGPAGLPRPGGHSAPQTSFPEPAPRITEQERTSNDFSYPPDNGPGTSRPRYDDEAIADADYYLPEGAAHADAPAEGAGAPPKDGAETCPDDEDHAVHPFKRRGGLSYYREIAPKLKEAFAKYPKDERLKGTFPHSEWVAAEGALLGVLYEEGQPRYLCVAMEHEPPAEAKEASIFVPLSPYSDEKGMFVVFQDADTGEYVRVREA